MAITDATSDAAADRASPVWRWLGRARFRDVLAEQLALRERVWAGDPGAVLLCEHEPVITLGRSATEAHILDARDIPIERIERGGEVTYHGPGQLMVYPVVRLRSVVGFLERVAAAIGDACAALGVPGAAWRRDPAGVWLDGKKLAACGIHVARGVSVHGFALDVDTPPEAWRAIRPCGLSVPQISLARVLGAPIAVERVARELGPRAVEAVRSMPAARVARTV
ncbi:MAG TPA: lipoyl(octanoyl) transferase LipB [Kofleriaceae bacterium]|nr:lipoyl(octanoyl) transferase LipB [Kofleriaceae bacterium]